MTNETNGEGGPWPSVEADGLPWHPEKRTFVEMIGLCLIYAYPKVVDLGAKSGSGLTRQRLKGAAEHLFGDEAASLCRPQTLAKSGAPPRALLPLMFNAFCRHGSSSAVRPRPPGREPGEWKDGFLFLYDTERAGLDHGVVGFEAGQGYERARASLSPLGLSESKFNRDAEALVRKLPAFERYLVDVASGAAYPRELAIVERLRGVQTALIAAGIRMDIDVVGLGLASLWDEQPDPGLEERA